MPLLSRCRWGCVLVGAVLALAAAVPRAAEECTFEDLERLEERDGRMTVIVEDRSVAEVLHIVCHASGIDLEVRGNVPGPKASVSMKDATVREILTKIGCEQRLEYIVTSPARLVAIIPDGEP